MKRLLKVKVEISRKFFSFLFQEAGAIFKYTSAKSSSGVDELFKNIGSRLLDPNKSGDDENFGEETKRKGTVQIRNDKSKNESVKNFEKK